MARATILKKNLNNDLWPEIILAMTYIQNFHPKIALENNNTPFNTQYKENLNISHLGMRKSKN